MVPVVMVIPRPLRVTRPHAPERAMTALLVVGAKGTG